MRQKDSSEELSFSLVSAWEFHRHRTTAERFRDGVVVKPLDSHQCGLVRSQSLCHMWVVFVCSLLRTERFFSGSSGFPLSSKTNIWFELICVNCQFQLTVSPVCAPVLERLDTLIKFLSVPKGYDGFLCAQDTINPWSNAALIVLKNDHDFWEISAEQEIRTRHIKQILPFVLYDVNKVRDNRFFRFGLFLLRIRQVSIRIGDSFTFLVVKRDILCWLVRFLFCFWLCLVYLRR